MDHGARGPAVTAVPGPLSAALRRFRLLAAISLTLLVASFPAASHSDPLPEFIENVAQFRFDEVTLQAFVNVQYIAEQDDEVIPLPAEFFLTCVTAGCTEPQITENQIGQSIARIDLSSGELDDFVLTVESDRFEIVDGILKLRDGVSLDFESEQSVFVSISVSNGDDSLTSFFSIPVVDVNESPSLISLDNNYVPPNRTGVFVGNLDIDDEDNEDVHDFEVNDDRFIVEGTRLKLRDDVALEENVELPVRIVGTDEGGLSIVLETFVTTSRIPTPSSIFLLAPGSNAEPVDMPPALCTPPGDFQYPDDPVQVPGHFLRPLPGVLPLDDTDAYAIGDPVFIRVDDQDENRNTEAVDSVEVILRVGSTGDEESVTLTETDVSTGIFVGYVFSTSAMSQQEDCILSVAPRSSVDATYRDRSSGDDISTALAFFSPVGIVFDDATGEPIDGVIVTLVDVETGEPTVVRGDGPGFAAYPSAVKTGEDTVDEAGQTYVHGAGEYRFPAIREGRYRLEVFNASGVLISEKPDEELQTLEASSRALEYTSQGRYFLNAASRGAVFEVAQGSLPRIDIPIRRLPRSVAASPAEITFLQYSSNPRVGTPVNVQQANCVADQARQVVELRDQQVPVPGLVNLLETDVIKAGQPIFVRVTDADQNVDPTVRERITIQLDVPASGDREYLEVTETEPDSGVFVGYVQTGDPSRDVGNCVLGVVKDEVIITSYVDAFDTTDTAESRVLVDPFGVIFSTGDGAPINGVAVSLVNVATGELAEVFGDGPAFARFPNPVVTGSTVEDEAGLSYAFPDGGYRFPFVEPGDYRIELDGVPAEFLFPSVIDDGAIQTLPGAPYALRSGSRGDEFEVPIGPALNIDLPVDPINLELTLSKTASPTTTAIGEFVQFRVRVQRAAGGGVSPVLITDRLPVGFRYEPGSLTLDGEGGIEPEIAANGRDMSVALDAMPPEGIELRYVTEVTAAANSGIAVNSVTASGPRVVDANTAEVEVLVREDLMRSEAILMGRVLYGGCDDPDAPGMGGVRLYLEDGSSVITDSEGRWHMEGVRPGTHVIQLDGDTLEDRHRIETCDGDAFRAGRGYSAFVDVKGGTLWRTNFRIVDRPVPTAEVSVAHAIERVDATKIRVAFDVTTDISQVAFNDVSLFYRMPGGWDYAGPGVVNGREASPTRTMVGHRWPLDVANENRVEFVLVAKADKGAAAENTMKMLRPRFGTRRATLDEEQLAEVKETLAGLDLKGLMRVRVLGHTDDVPIAPQNRVYFDSNVALSMARAETIADLVRQHVPAAVEIDVQGLGPSRPMVPNNSRRNRALNRRVELLLEYAATPAVALEGESSGIVRFNTADDKRGRTEASKLELTGLLEHSRLEDAVAGTAQGSWDILATASVADSGDAEADPSTMGILSLRDGEMISQNTRAIRVRLDSAHLPRLSVDGEPVDRNQIGITIRERGGTTVYSYVGVAIGATPGERRILLEGVDKAGDVQFEQAISIARTGEINSLSIATVPGNIADGSTPVRARVTLRDAHLRKVDSSTRLRIVSGDLRANVGERQRLETNAGDTSTVNVGPTGIVQFAPVARAGRYRVELAYEDVVEQGEIVVDPETREWILVGLAEGTVGSKDLESVMDPLDEATSEDYYKDGRLAFFAKGQILGENLLTLSYDSDRVRDDRLFGRFNPGQYYTLYGDASQRQFETASQEKLFVRLERSQFNAVYGDFGTDLNYTELARYQRALTGLRSDFEIGGFRARVFAAETTQGFVRDEIRGLGTSGIYDLSREKILFNTEEIRIEVRDRQRPEEVVEEEQLLRGFDYTIDYDRGEIIFKSPVPGQDEALNPVFIVATYEIDVEGEEKLTAGGRLAYEAGDLTVGATYVDEATEGREAELEGVDVTWEPGPNMRLRAEAARSTSTDEEGTESGNAWLVDYEVRTEIMDVNAYVREQDDGFGVQQISGVASGTRQVGVDVTTNMGEQTRGRASGRQETNLATGQTRDIVNSTLELRSDKGRYEIGVEAARDSDTLDAEGETSVLASVTAQRTIMDGRATVSLVGLSPIGGGENEAAPPRVQVGGSYQLIEGVTLRAIQEFTFGAPENTQGTRFGIDAEPWQGGRITSSLERQFQDASETLLANYGIQQRWDASENWAFDFGVDRSQRSTTSKKTDDVRPDAPPTFGPGAGGNYTSYYASATWRKDTWEAVSRLEQRLASEDQLNIAVGLKHELDDGFTLAAIFSSRARDGLEGEESRQALNFGLAFRPDDSPWVLLNRLDVIRDYSATAEPGLVRETSKLVNNLNANRMFTDGSQLSLQLGLKYVLDNIDDREYSGFTDLFGVEYRKVLGDGWDIGVNTAMLSSRNADVTDYSFGLSVGRQFAPNSWASLGYNFDGFSDPDFDDSDYTSKGVYLKFRFKFDQDSTKALFKENDVFSEPDS